MSGFGDLLERDPERRAEVMQDFNPGKYRGLIRHIGQIKENIDEDREKYEWEQRRLQWKIENQENVSKLVQKSLSQQVDITNRGYSQLLVQYHSKIEEWKNSEHKIGLLEKEIELASKEREVELKKLHVQYKAQLNEKDNEIAILER